MNKGAHGYLNAAMPRSKGSPGRAWPEMGGFQILEASDFLLFVWEG